MIVAIALGCQRLPEDESPPTWGDDSASTGPGFPPATPDMDGADSTGTEGAPPADPTVCIPGLTMPGSLDLQEYAGVEVIEGSLSLTGITDDDLAWLQCVQVVEGQFRIYATDSLTSLHGLERLRVVGSELWLLNNDALVELDALSGLEHAGALMVEGHPVLDNLDGVAHLDSVGQLAIRSNPLITTIAFPQLTTALGVAIYDNAAVSTLDLGALTHVDGGVFVAQMPALTELSGLAALSEVEEFGLGGQTGLSGTTDLVGLRRIEDRLLVNDLAGIETLEFPAVEQLGHLHVLDSPDLVGIELPALTQIERVELTGLDSLASPPQLAGASGLRTLRVRDVPVLSSLTWAGGLETSSDYVLITDAPQLTDLGPLVGVSELSIGVHLENLPALADLSELSTLTNVGQDVVLRGLPLVDDLSPLSSITAIGTPGGATFDGLFIEQLDALTSLDGLESLAVIEGSLYVLGNDSLVSMAALSGLTELEETFIHDNASLTSLAGLEAVQLIYRLEVIDNPSLTSLSGLAGLEATQSIAIQNNDLLVDLEGLGGVESVYFELIIADNAALTSIDALWPAPAGVFEFGSGAMTIRDNPALSQCTVDTFVQLLVDQGWFGPLEVSGNLPCRR
ncbi:MAG: hypothetical protein AAF799_00015 [Myxococcota bacterium]